MPDLKPKDARHLQAPERDAASVPFRVTAAGLCMATSLALLTIAGTIVVGLVGYCITWRLAYPYELEWMEGLMAEHIARARAGENIYPAPSGSFIALLYTPLHYYCAAALTFIGLDDLRAGRCAALIGLLGAIATGMWLVQRTTGRPWLTLVVPALTASAYFAVDSYYDVGRADGLLCACLMLSVAALTLRREWSATLLFVCSAVLAVYLKQSALVFYFVLLAGVWRFRPRPALIGGAAFAGLVVLIALLAHFQTQGWFLFYVLTTPRAIGMTQAGFTRALTEDFFGGFVLQTLALLASVGIWLARGAPAHAPPDTLAPPRDRHYAIVLWGAVACAVLCLAARAAEGGAHNVLIPYAVTTAALLPIALARMADALSDPGRRRLAWAAALLFLTLVTLRGLRDPTAYLPAAADRAKWREFQRALDRLDDAGPVWVMNHGAPQGALPAANGRANAGPHTMALVNYLATQPGVLALPEDLRERIRTRHFAAIVVREYEPAADQFLRPHYAPDPAREPFDLPLFCGAPVGKEQVWLPTGRRR